MNSSACRLLLACGIVVLSSSWLPANAPDPPPQRFDGDRPAPSNFDDKQTEAPAAKKIVPLVVRVDGTSQKSTLVIPRRFLANRKPQGGAGSGGGEGGEPTAESDDATVGSIGRVRTIVAGLALSLAIAGFVLLKRGGWRRYAAVAALGGGLALGTGAFTWANAPPPVPNDPPPSPFGPIDRLSRDAPAERTDGDGHIVLKVTPKGHSVILVVGEDLRDRINAKIKSPADGAAAESPPQLRFAE